MPDRLPIVGVIDTTSLPAAGMSAPNTPMGAGGGAGRAGGWGAGALLASSAAVDPVAIRASAAPATFCLSAQLSFRLLVMFGCRSRSARRAGKKKPLFEGDRGMRGPLNSGVAGDGPSLDRANAGVKVIGKYQAKLLVAALPPNSIM